MSTYGDIVVNLNDLAFFVHAVDHGGFASAARALGLPRSTISKRVGELEQALSVILVERSSRNFRLTPLGAAFYRHAAASLAEAEAAKDIISRHLAEPQGQVRITASVTRSKLLAPVLPELARLYPKAQFELQATDAVIDIKQEGVDIAIRSHFSDLSASDLIQRRLDSQSIILVASPSYLQRAGTPEKPEDLQNHDGLVADLQTAGSGWLIRSSDAAKRVFPRRRLVSNETAVLEQAAVAGLGVACLPERLCTSRLSQGELVRVLPQHHAGTLQTSLLMPPRRGEIPAVRAAVDFIVAHFSSQAKA